MAIVEAGDYNGNERYFSWFVQNAPQNSKDRFLLPITRGEDFLLPFLVFASFATANQLKKMLPDQSIPLLSPKAWPDYELLDCGHFEKLERFGAYILRRPEPQALWAPGLTPREWETRHDAWFQKAKGSMEAGFWVLKKDVPNKWFNRFLRKDSGLDISYKVSLSSFKHVGIFPEQAANWDYLFSALSELKSSPRFVSSRTEADVVREDTNHGTTEVRNLCAAPKVLNLFAYTGIASLVAKAAGADVTHLDSIKQVVGWARENMEASRLDGIRWMVDDALKFTQREARRQNQYQCLILDPPAYGRGPDGEKWILEEHLPTLLEACTQILDPQNFICIINLYSLGFSALILENLIRQYFPNAKAETGEIHLLDSFGKKLPLGTFGRFCSW